MNVLKRFGPLLAAALLVAACSTSGQGTSESGVQLASAGTSLPAPTLSFASASSAEPDYRIGALDMLEISVFQVPDLSKTVQVNSSGQITLPLIGSVTAGGKTVSELESDLAATLGAKYLQDPQVSVFVKESTSQRVTVDGAVEKPGIVPLTGQMTLLQTIAVSGGLTKAANPKGIVVFRNTGGKRMAAKFDLKAIRAGTAEDPVVYAGDVIVVDTSAMRSALSSITEGLPVFSLFMPLI